MLKKFFYGMMAATMLVATSCADDPMVDPAGETSTVSFSISTPEIATRTFNDGKTATHLQYAVYNANGDILTDLTVVDATINISTTIDLQLTTGNTYSILFWAAAPGTDYYTVDLTNKKMTVDYSKAVSNDEARDAFFAYETFTVEGNMQKRIELRRPFAQLNIGTNDLLASKKAGYEIAQSWVSVPVYSGMDLSTGAVLGSPEVREFALANIPVGETFPVADYEYLAMNYLLVGGIAEPELVEVEFGYTNTANVKDANKKRKVGSVPLRRNYRTNLYGQLLTSNAKIEIEIMPIPFTGDHNVYYVEGENTYHVVNEQGLQEIADKINSGDADYQNVNIAIDGDIDLASFAAPTRSAASNWTPIGTEENPFMGTFDGNGFTIKNLNIVETEAKEGKAFIGFFGYAKNATIKNVKFENVNLNIACLDIDHSQGHIGAVAGSLEGTSTIENVTVKGLVTVEATTTANGASRVAVVAGGNSYGNVTMKNVHVIANEGSYLKANNNVGALAGQLQGKSVFENCSSNIDVTGTKFFAGGIIGLAAGDQLFTNCHTTGDVAITAGREGRAHDHYRVGGIAGGWADGAKNVCTLNGCSYTGQLSGVNADGSVAEKFDYMGYVGRGYTLNGCQGSKVVIDGTEFVQKYNTAAEAGVYTVNGCTPVYTADELVATLADGENVYLMNDITVAATKGGYDKAGILQNKAQTIDGGGHTLTVTGAGATWSCAIYTNGGIIRNLTVAGAMRGIFTAGQSADLHIENVEFKNVVYTFNSDGKMPANPFGVYVSNSKVNGWTSHSNMHTEVVYTNCSFGEGSGYKYCRPYGKTAFVNCTFCAGYNIDKTRTTELTFTDCTWE